MKVILERGVLVLVPQGEDEANGLAEWKERHAEHVLFAQRTAGEGLLLADLGPKDEACAVPINISSRLADPAWVPISNFAAAPFEMDGLAYASVEGFRQGLKFADERERRRVGALVGSEAMRAGGEVGYGETVTYGGEAIPVGTWRHWALMERACRAKFTQDGPAREALLSTGTRPLTHRMRRDSKAIPGVIMAGIWMRIRQELREALGEGEGA